MECAVLDLAMPWSRDNFKINAVLYDKDRSLCSALEAGVWVSVVLVLSFIVMLCHHISSHVMLCYVFLSHNMSSNVTSCHDMICNIMSINIPQCHFFTYRILHILISLPLNQ